MARELKRININFPVETLDRVDDYAERMSINRTSAILVLLSQALDGYKTVDTLDELIKLVKLEQNNKTDQVKKMHCEL